MELTIWVEQHGAVEVAGNVRGALEIISKNEEFINMTLAILMPPSDQIPVATSRQAAISRPFVGLQHQGRFNLTSVHDWGSGQSIKSA